MSVRGIHPATGQPIDIQIAGGSIAAVNEADEPSDIFVSPGWLDLQVNGFAGVDYNDPRSPADEIARSIESQRLTGVARFLPTVITGGREDMLGSLRNLTRAKRTLSSGDAMLGFHVEGPWISPHDGPRGAHPQAHVRAPSIEEFQQLQDAAEGQIRLVTLQSRAQRVSRRHRAHGKFRRGGVDRAHRGFGKRNRGRGGQRAQP